MCITICGRFRLNEGGVAGYGNRMKAKYTVNWGVQIAGMIFQTRSSILIGFFCGMDENAERGFEDSLDNCGFLED